jgi:hypothetical protein
LQRGFSAYRAFGEFAIFWLEYGTRRTTWVRFGRPLIFLSFFNMVGSDDDVGARETPMDDFLHNLRNPNKKRYDRNKPYDSQHRANDRFAGNRKTPPQQQRKHPDSDQMPAIKRLVESILEQQKRLAEFNERLARAAERQSEALESIARHFGRQPAAQAAAPARAQAVPAEPPVEATAATDDGDPRRATEVIILQQRATGHSFEQIAQTLNTSGISTVSGKGQWRAQSVSRLYNALTSAGPAEIDNAASPA